MSPQDRKIRILAIDDEEIYLHAIVGLLADTYKIIIALSGEQGLKLAQSDPPPDLILLDVMMPDMGGFEVCRQLKSDPRTKDIPVVFLSALEEVENKTKGFEVGGVDYITKPFQGEEVQARVKTHIENQELHRRLAARAALRRRPGHRRPGRPFRRRRRSAPARRDQPWPLLPLPQSRLAKPPRSPRGRGRKVSPRCGFP